MVLFALLIASPISARAAEDNVLAPGDAIVTGFSGIKPADKAVPNGGNPLDYFFIDLDGPSAQILSLSLLGGPPGGQLAPAAIKRKITAREVGQVFAIALDDGHGNGTPSFYLGATSAFGIEIVAPDSSGGGLPKRLKTGGPVARFMAGQFGPGGGPGSIWRVDGATGAVSLFATLPENSGPGIGDIVFDTASRQFFVSDLDKGLIYRLGEDGRVIDGFDHGVNGRPANGQPAVADDGQVMNITNPAFDSEKPETWGFTQKVRMVWGLAVHDGRLYYAVAGQVWSIGISTGGFAGDARWEFDATALSGDGPVTHMLFDSAGRIYLAQRGAARGSYDYSVFAEPEKSAVVRYSREAPDNPATPSAWQSNPEEYAIGMRPEYRFANGGIALGYGYDESGTVKPNSCGQMLWSTGDRLRASENPSEPDPGSGDADVEGLQGNDASLVRPQNTPPSDSYFIDYDSLFGDPENRNLAGLPRRLSACFSSRRLVWNGMCGGGNSGGKLGGGVSLGGW